MSSEEISTVSSEAFESLVDKDKLQKQKIERERMHWNLLVDAKKNPVRVREALVASIFQEFTESSLFFETTTHEKHTLAKYHMALIQVFGKAFSPLIPDVPLNKNYDKHLEYMEKLKSVFYQADKELFTQVPKATESISLQQLKSKISLLTQDDVGSRRIAVAVGANLSLELMNCKEFVTIFEPVTDPGHAMRGRLGSILVEGEPCIPLLSDCMRKEEDRALNTDSLYWCDKFVANLKIKHNNTLESLIFRADTVKGATEYGYTGTAVLN